MCAGCSLQELNVLAGEGTAQVAKVTSGAKLKVVLLILTSFPGSTPQHYTVCAKKGGEWSLGTRLALHVCKSTGIVTATLTLLWTNNFKISIEI